VTLTDYDIIIFIKGTVHNSHFGLTLWVCIDQWNLERNGMVSVFGQFKKQVVVYLSETLVNHHVLKNLPTWSMKLNV
jgi:hypothetical protein